MHAEVESLLLSISCKMSELLLNCTDASFKHITALQANPVNPGVGSLWSGYKSTRIAQMTQIKHTYCTGVRMLLGVLEKFLLYTDGT